MRGFVVHIVFLCMIQVLNAQQWTVHNTPRSRQINDVTILSQNIFVIVGGHPSNDSITYMAHSSSAGQSWEIFTDLFPGKMIKSSIFINNQVGYCAGYNEAFYKTTDGGKNWQTHNPNVNLNKRNINKLFQAQYGVLYAAGGLSETNGFLIKSIDAGNTWQLVYQWIDNEVVSAVSPKYNKIIVAGSNGFLQFSTDGAESWQNCDFPDAGYIPDFTSISFIDENNGYCTGGSKGTDTTALVLKTTDGGQTWTISYNAVAPCLNNISMASYQIAYAVGDGGKVLKTQDGGLNWNQEIIDGNPGEDLFTVKFLNTHIGVIAGRWGYVMTFDDGQSILPEVTTNEASNITNTNATLKALINPGFSNSEVSFLYGLDETTNTEVYVGTFTGGEQQTIQHTLSLLEPDTKYFFRAKLNNTYGEYLGDLKYFYTGNPIPNWDFEEWGTFSGEYPLNWIITGYVTKISTDDGFAAGIYPDNQNGDVSGLLNGKIDADFIDSEIIMLDYEGGCPISNKPEGISCSINYDIDDQDSALVGIFLKKQGELIAKNWHFFKGSSNGNYIDTTFTIEYFYDIIPDTLIFGIVNSSPLNQKSDISSFIEIKKIWYSYNENQNIIEDFSNWNNYQFDFPLNWDYKTDGLNDWHNFDVMFYKTEESYHNDYAICLQYINGNDDYSQLSAREDSSFFSIYNKHNKLQAYIKYIPDGIDTAFIQIDLYASGEILTSSHYDIFEEYTNWTKIEIPITYPDNEIIPDGANISISPSISANHNKSSLLCVDKICFDGDYVPIANKLFNAIQIYPNPAKDYIYINFNYDQNNLQFYEIFDIFGRLIEKDLIESEKNTYKINISNFSEGFYYLILKTDEINYKTKFIKI